MTRLPSLSIVCMFALAACEPTSAPESTVDAASEISWPGESWQGSTPEQEDLDAQAIAQLDEEIRAGEHGYINSMLIIRGGRMAFEAYYEHDYRELNADLVTGE